MDSSPNQIPSALQTTPGNNLGASGNTENTLYIYALQMCVYIYIIYIYLSI